MTIFQVDKDNYKPDLISIEKFFKKFSKSEDNIEKNIQIIYSENENNGMYFRFPSILIFICKYNLIFSIYRRVSRQLASQNLQYGMESNIKQYFTWKHRKSSTGSYDRLQPLKNSK